MVNSMARRNGSLERRLKIFELSKNAQEQARNWLLSILASVFLPLSLATSILSMQTRFVDLHFLLYDFCGVIVLLATLVLMVLLVVSAIVYCREKLAKLETNAPRFGTLFKRIALPILFGVLCSLDGYYSFVYLRHDCRRQAGVENSRLWSSRGFRNCASPDIWGCLLYR